MWYAVLNREVQMYERTIKAGSIYQVVKRSDEEIHAIPVEGESARDVGRMILSTSTARQMFTRPTKDFNSAIEESIMQCEANYC